MLGLADLRLVWGKKYTQCFVGITHRKAAIWNTEKDMRGELGCGGRGGGGTDSGVCSCVAPPGPILYGVSF
jgi:hypothetical protein